jgi:hypothetical protein
LITLKNGHRVEYNSDFDQFFRDLLEAIIQESKMELMRETELSPEDYNEAFLKEIMDNCIYVVHQLFEIRKENEEMSRFIITGFMFNSIIMTLPFITSESDKEEAQNDEQADRGDNVSDEEDDDSTTVH